MLRSFFLSPRARRRWLVVFIALCVVTLVVALLPAERAPEATGWDKLDHAMAFAALGVAGVFALRWRRLGVAWLLPFLAALGGLIEWLQMYAPSRQSDFGDFVADVLGAAAGVVLAWLVARAVERRGEPD